MRRFVHLLRPHALWLVLAPIAMMVEVAMDLMQPKLMSRIVDDGIALGDQAAIYRHGLRMLLYAFVGPHRQPMRVGVFMRRDDRVEVVGDAVPLRPEVRIADRARAGVNRLGMGRCPAQQGPRGHDAPHLTEPFLFGATPEQTVDAGSQAKTLQGNKGNGREQQR